MHHDFNPHLPFDSDTDLRLYRLRYLCRWPLRRIARCLTKLDNLYHLKPLRPHRPAPKRRRLRLMSLSQISNI